MVERLARRCGFEAMAAVMPPSDAKLLAHIRKQCSRRQRKRSEGSEVRGGWGGREGEGEGGRQAAFGEGGKEDVFLDHT